MRMFSSRVPAASITEKLCAHPCNTVTHPLHYQFNHATHPSKHLKSYLAVLHGRCDYRCSGCSKHISPARHHQKVEEEHVTAGNKAMGCEEHTAVAARARVMMQVQLPSSCSDARLIRQV